LLQFDLVKSTEVLQFALEKRNITEIAPCQVNLTFDVSYSFDDEHCAGYTQALLNRFVPFAMLFDKDKTLGSYVFATRAEQLVDINISNFKDYIRRQVQTCSTYNGGTSYVPIFNLLINECRTPAVVEQPKQSGGLFSRLFGKSTKVQDPVAQPVVDKHLHFFVTDGEAGDQTRAKELLDDLTAQNKNAYFVFISVGNREISFLRNSFGGTDYSDYLNFTSAELKTLQSMPDEQLYDLLLTDTLIEWMNR